MSDHSVGDESLRISFSVLIVVMITVIHQTAAAAVRIRHLVQHSVQYSTVKLPGPGKHIKRQKAMVVHMRRPTSYFSLSYIGVTRVTGLENNSHLSSGFQT